MEEEELNREPEEAPVKFALERPTWSASAISTEPETLEVRSSGDGDQVSENLNESQRSSVYPDARAQSTLKEETSSSLTPAQASITSGLFTQLLSPQEEEVRVDRGDLSLTQTNKVVDPPDRFSLVLSPNLYPYTILSDMTCGTPTPVLGNCPTLLTPQGKIPAVAVLQVEEPRKKRPPDKFECGGSKRKREKVPLWSISDLDGLRYEPFHRLSHNTVRRPDAPTGLMGYG